ncbi:MAG: DNA polymerase III subunit gamma/tau [Patescibacteria group bacterium]
MPNLSRTYRPSKFAEICGQTGVTEILRKEVEQQKLGHAYLFSGPRGVGKTTAARIFAKAVNCIDQKDGEPCHKCRACEQVAKGSIDVIEMDAASNTGDDNVREAIVEHVRFVPSELKYKVYIIDEAHMLSTSAWNALLKTIEEPPEHALFIFATTEKHKVPATIVSRCQRFDFRRISSDDIIKRLKELTEKEGYKVEDTIYSSIAARAEGCLRDAENLLGQLFSLGEKNITRDIASLVIPQSQLPMAVDLLTLAAKRDSSSALQKIQDLEQEGAAFLPLFDDLIAAVRSLMLATSVAREAEALKSGEESSKALATLIGQFEEGELLNISLVLMERRKEAKQGLDSRFALEMAMVAITVGATRTDHADKGGPSGHALPPTSPHPCPSPTKAGEGFKPPQPPTSPPAIKQDPSASSDEAPPLPKGGTEPSPPAPLPHMQERGVSNSKITESPLSPRPPAYEVGGGSAVSSLSSFSINDVYLWWPKLLAALENNKSLLFILKLCKPCEIKDSTIVLNFQYPYHQQTILKNQKNKLLVENTLREVSGHNDLMIEGRVGSVQDESSPAQPIQNKDTVTRLLDAFGGQVIA